MPLQPRPSMLRRLRRRHWHRMFRSPLPLQRRHRPPQRRAPRRRPQRRFPPQASSAPTLVLAAAPAAARPPVGTLAVAAFPEAAPAPESQPQATLAAQRAPEAVTAAPRAPDALQAAPREPEALAALTQKPDAAALPQTATAAPAAPEVTTETNPVASATLPSEKATASLAWSVGGKTVTDPVSLAAIQAFMQEGDLGSSASDAGEVRDDIAGLLAGVPCSRLQAAFIPETGKLELRGHVPENGLRAPVLAALQAQVGAEISVTDNLLILPRPQCGALSGISDVGLPQSTDQFTDARLIGNDAHAQEYRYSEGQRLEFDMQAPDYDGVFYVDFFDADGQVIHLVPNEVIPLTEQPAKSALNIGGDRRDGAPGLNITIGPPFGQEIAVAFAASVPLYEGLRPLVEPAEPYLVFLKEQVAEAREMHRDFKGEWVYFFITTSPATQ